MDMVENYMVSLWRNEELAQAREKNSFALGSEDWGLGVRSQSPRSKLLVCSDEDEVRMGARRAHLGGNGLASKCGILCGDEDAFGKRNECT